MKSVIPKLLVCMAALTVSGCMPASLSGQLPSGSVVAISFYPGGNALDDLMIIDATNYFGKAEYQYDNPVGDIGFMLKSGERVQAECTSVGKDAIDNDECKKYEVYRSTFDLIPVGTKFDRPEVF